MGSELIIKLSHESNPDTSIPMALEALKNLGFRTHTLKAFTSVTFRISDNFNKPDSSDTVQVQK